MPSFSSHWQLTIQGTNIASTAKPYLQASGMILDSGATDILVPTHDLEAILAMIPAARACSKDSTTNRIKCTCAAGTTFTATEQAVLTYFGTTNNFPSLSFKLGSPA